MAKKYYDGDITLNTDWGGDASTGNLPVIGEKVQKVIKDSINSKVGYVGYVEKVGQGFYVLCRDAEVFKAYEETITEDQPFGDLGLDGVNGKFDAPFNYKMDITLITPDSGYISKPVNHTNNVIEFKAGTLDSSDSPVLESLTVTYKVKTEGGVESTYTAIYDGNTALQGIVYNLDGKLGTGINTVTITVVGMNTGVSAMRRITYRLVDISFKDRFDIAKRYQFVDGILEMNIGYDLKGIGKTKLLWKIDNGEPVTDEITNLNPNLSNMVKTFVFTENVNIGLTPGVHTLQVTMICTDTDSNEEFATPIYYREFIIEKTPTVLETPYIVRRATFDYKKGFMKNNDVLTIYDAKQYENVLLEYAAYYNGKFSCLVKNFIRYGNGDLEEVASEDLPIKAYGFSDIQKQNISLTKDGLAEIITRAYYGDEYFEVKTQLQIQPSDMNITTVEDSVVLYLNAFGRSNNADGKDVWEYRYTANNTEKVITTRFSKNEYVVISTYDAKNNIVPPYDAKEENTLIVDTIPTTEIPNYKYLLFNDEYYIWDKEFDWSDTSGWSDNKLKLAKGNSITIDYTPFGEDKYNSIKSRGATFEFEFETTNVYNDDAVICRICGKNDFAPGISIYASGAELVISRTIDAEGENAGYSKAVSTKYKAEENNRISFVITANSDDKDYRNRILSIYVNGEYCGAHNFDTNTIFTNDSKITFRGSDDACVNISSIKMYSRALSSNEILNNYIYYRNDAQLKANIYKRNDIVLSTDDTKFDSAKLLSQLPVMTFYQIDEDNSLDDIHQEKKDKKLVRFFDVVYTDIQNPSKNFLIKNAYVTPQGTSSMNYPVKNLRLYTGKKDKAKNYYSRLYVGSNIFLDGSHTNLADNNINPESEVTKRKYAFKDGSIPVNCWTLKADFAESSSSHNTGTSRFWNNVLKSAGLYTKAQLKAEKHKEEYPYDIRTAIDGFPIVVFYQASGETAPRFEGKYNFNNDKSTEDVFGFTGGIELDDQEVQYFYIGKEMPVIHSEKDDDGNIEYACSFEHGGYTEHPTVDSPLYVSKYLEDGSEEWYMLRGVELLDNPKMECWELLNSVNELALFKTMKGFSVGDDDEKVGITAVESGTTKFYEAFESRYPDCGDYFHTNSLRRFGEWLVSCRYLDIDNTTGIAVPFSDVPEENYYRKEEKISICSLTKKEGVFTFDFPGYNFYREVSFNDISSNIKAEGYQKVTIAESAVTDLHYLVVTELPTEKNPEYDYIKYGNVFYTWMPSNVLTTDTLPVYHEAAYDYVQVGDKYYAWLNTYKFSDYYTPQWVDDNAFNRALKFSVEKYDHIEMDKMAAYYIYLLRFGGVDQTVKNAMLTTEGPATNDPNSTLPSLWYFINYDNDTILGVKNDGRLVFDPYITRETKDGTGYVYAGRESTLWNNLEADVDFMNHVTTIDNKLASATGDTRFALSYNNALREYDTNQSDKWCERIYNQDAERKYIDTFVKGWTQKYVDGDNTVETHVYENYLYDVQGSRSAHRKWWLGRRFNVYDSRFCNTNFKNSLVKFRSTNLPAGSSFTIKSGEPIFYAWGHDNSVTEMTPQAVQPGESYTFTTRSTFNIGSYLELMGSANISTLDLRNCVGALTELDITGCYSAAVGTKLKELLVGDSNRNDLVNISNTSMKFSGLANATKLETIDFTNIRNLIDMDGLDTLLNLREVYAKGTSISNFTFADGTNIEHIELPASVETLSLTRSSSIDYENIVFENGGYGKLRNLTIDNCTKLMNDSTFVLQWIKNTPEQERKNLSLNLQGINWTFDFGTYQGLYLLENVGTTVQSERIIRGTIEITTNLGVSDIKRLKKIFGDNCFKEGSEVYIKAPLGLYVDTQQIIWEGDNNVRCEITTVGTTLGGKLTVNAEVVELIDGVEKTSLISATNGIITMDESNLNKGYVLINVAESAKNYVMLNINVRYKATDGTEREQTSSPNIKKRIYPEICEVVTLKDSYNTKDPVNMNIKYNPVTIDDIEYDINDTQLEGRGIFNVQWAMVTGSTDYDSKLELEDFNTEVCKITAPNGFDGQVRVKVTISRNFDNLELCSAEKELEFTNPDTIITPYSNKALFDILADPKVGIIVPDETGFGKLTKQQAKTITMDKFLIKDSDGNVIKSIFAGNTELESFVELQWFENTNMGQMPSAMNLITTPDKMFAGCSNLREIAFSSNFHYTGKNMFEGCRNLEYIYGEERGVVNDVPVYDSLAFIHVGDNFAKDCSKLKQCLLSNTCVYIGDRAFAGCSNLSTFLVPTNPEMVIKHNTMYNAFEGCSNIIFNGAQYGSATEAKYQIKDGACYEKNDDTFTLIHLGKNSLISNIITDKTVYATSYAMEYRTSSDELDIVVPNNIIFNGNAIFNNSSGNSITLTNLLPSSVNCKSLFAKTHYKHYIFAQNETKIPSNCFENALLETFVVPEGIEVIEAEAFYNCPNLTMLTLPTTLSTIQDRAFNISTNLKNIVCKGARVPAMTNRAFFGVMLDNVYVNPKDYDTYKNNLVVSLRPFVKPLYLYEEGYVRIINEAKYLVCDEKNIVTVGGISVIQGEDYFMRYISDGANSNLNVTVNGQVVGEVSSQYTTLYIGDNSTLFSGNGYNFTKGVFDSDIATMLEEKGWFYDVRFEGIRNNPNGRTGQTEITLSLDNADVLTPITYGYYAKTPQSGKPYGYINDDNNVEKLHITESNYQVTENLVTGNGVFKIGFVYSSTPEGINGIVINSLGNRIYSDPELPTAMTYTRNMVSPVKTIVVQLSAKEEIPSDVYVTITDNRSQVYRKFWNGTSLTFNIPSNLEFDISATDFVVNGKVYTVEKVVKIDENIFEIIYTKKIGFELTNNILAYHTDDADWYINLITEESTWGTMGMNIQSTNVDEILVSNAYGLENCSLIEKIDKNSICSKALISNVFDKGIIAYIPSFIELEILSQHLFEINEYLYLRGLAPIDFSNCWVSETFDENNAWTSNGTYVTKNTVLKYYILGKRITL